MCGGAQLSRQLLVLTMQRPFNPFLALLKVTTCSSPGTMDLGLAFRPMEESMDVVPAFAFPEFRGRGGSCLTLILRRFKSGIFH